LFPVSLLYYYRQKSFSEFRIIIEDNPDLIDIHIIFVPYGINTVTKFKDWVADNEKYVRRMIREDNEDCGIPNWTKHSKWVIDFNSLTTTMDYKRPYRKMKK